MFRSFDISSIFPKRKIYAYQHRIIKRKKEIKLIIETIENHTRTKFGNKFINILEFGSGRGFQLPYLKTIGHVIGSDIYISNALSVLNMTDFVQCSVVEMPFKNACFDVIFSNHVIEHIQHVEDGLKEIKRIGKADCIYAFSVPTNLWLALSIPAYYYNQIKAIWVKLHFSKINRSKSERPKPTSSVSNRSDKSENRVRFIRRFLPSGHGATLGFLNCYRKFKRENWNKLFLENGFSVIAEKPLLLYGPSEWPIIPTLECKSIWCSSVLFIMEKADSTDQI